jgi:uncharacterized protein (TIGR03000 family)
MSLQRYVLWLGLLAVAVVTLLISPAPASAQTNPYWGSPYLGRGYGYAGASRTPYLNNPYGGENPYWGHPYIGRGYGYEEAYNSWIASPVVVYPSIQPTYASFYREPPRNEALIDVRIPANAELWFSGEKTSQTGELRSFISPELTTGKDFFYTLKARWIQDGKPVEQTRRIRVSAGAQANVDFFRAEQE